ncbi:hypothetical protein [Paracoccus aminophilus]|uniref:Uncharacterized protein n=1 Tax=Paracoccus aminophilus JCM 7686 TaxID=1367847 RepID=S5Z0R4_PARAH|nr:hypothetical protein [Paracoccus aminophilus]AGT11031.1 hypothetical protein JCM7686_pAMI4p345 [Paracoccus aminophilus JCM 7686]
MGKNPTADYDLPADELTELRSKSNSAKAACCDCVYRKDGIHGPSGKISQLRFDGVTKNGQSDTGFKAEIIIDSQSADKKVYVSTRMKAVNKTADTARYPSTVALSDADLTTAIANIPASIRAAWNARPYKLKITDSKCGERLYTVTFNATFTEASPHYAVDFMNVPMTVTTPDYKSLESWRSYVLPSSYTAKFNIDDSRSATKSSGDKTLEPHEYGHMIGLKDEYTDEPADRNGCIYEFYNGTTQKVGANGELMGNMSHHTAQPERYCLTIAYAVVAVFAQNGVRVTALEIL